MEVPDRRRVSIGGLIFLKPVGPLRDGVVLLPRQRGKQPRLSHFPIALDRFRRNSRGQFRTVHVLGRHRAVRQVPGPCRCLAVFFVVLRGKLPLGRDVQLQYSLNRDPIQVPLGGAVIERIDVQRRPRPDASFVDPARSRQVGYFLFGMESPCRDSW
jgi:hypothetical protein